MQSSIDRFAVNIHYYIGRQFFSLINFSHNNKKAICVNQYTCKAFRDVLSKAGAKQSLNDVNHCHNNSRTESFLQY